jgi:hypothetical protein
MLMADSLSVDVISRLVHNWARDQPLILRIYLFGSRAKGSARPDSDIDLAVLCRIDRKILPQVSGNFAQARMFTWWDHRKGWHDALSALFPVPVQIEIPQKNDRIVRPAVKSSGIRIY